MKTIFSFLLAFVAFFFACNTSKNTNSEAMKKAFQLHTESSQIEKELTPELETLIQIRNQINIMGRQLTESEMSKIERINQIESSLKFWKENLPDVPGFEHEHHDHEGPCKHDYGKKLELMPEDWIRVQQEFKDSIIVIKSRVEDLMKAENSKDQKFN